MKNSVTWQRKSSTKRFSSDLLKKGEVILNSLNDFVRSIEVVDRQTYKNLSLCFVHTKEQQDFQIKNYAEAIEDKSLVVTEIDDSVNVPELRFQNKGVMPVFIPEGGGECP
jgi:hypothetical protein